MSRKELEDRIAFKREALEELRGAYLALLKGRVKSYMIDDRQLTRLDLGTLKKHISEAENELDELEALLDGKKPRKSVGVIIRDW